MNTTEPVPKGILVCCDHPDQIVYEPTFWPGGWPMGGRSTPCTKCWHRGRYALSRPLGFDGTEGAP